jgi:hypothetical protein
MSTTERPLHIDIPVKLSDIKIAFSVAALAFEGDLPASIFHLQLITRDIAAWGRAVAGHRRLAYPGRPRDAARRCVQRRSGDIDGQPVQRTPE